MKYEVVQSKVWRHKITGKRVSIYGASPWQTQADKDQWELVVTGWTVRNPITGQIGIGLPPCTTKEGAEALAKRLGTPSSIGIGD